MVKHNQPIQIDAAILQEYVDALGSIGWQADGGDLRSKLEGDAKRGRA